MFDNLSEKLNTVFKKLRGHGTLSEANIQEALKEVRMALLEADVNFKVAKDFIDSVKSKAMGAEVMQSLTPAQQMIKVVRDELASLMGGVVVPIDTAARPPIPIMLVGLQGSGKTTTAGKLARHLKSKGKRPYLVPADVYRPAAILQLKRLGEQLSIDVYDSNAGDDPLKICQEAFRAADRGGYDYVILDTAGRLHIDDELMQELSAIKGAISPREILFVADAMIGQDAVNVAKAFDERLDLTGVVLTKLDGDARGGVALSVKAVTGKPIKFIGVGEKLDAFEPFHPDRMASRILGMGDVLTLIEKAHDAFDQKKAEELGNKLKKDSFTLDDFKDQLQQIKKMGSFGDILGMIPGLGKLKGVKEMAPDEKDIKRIEAIINSMTRIERREPSILNGNRRLRIAKGSGTSVQDVNQLVKRYAEARKMMKRFTAGGMKGMKRGMPLFR
ncbi:MAG: signal recognition particle protein [Deltaproteobacteria bacterium]